MTVTDEELPRYDLTLADLADHPDVFWLQRGFERLTGWVAAATDPQQRRERAEYANAVLEVFEHRGDGLAIIESRHTTADDGRHSP